MRRKYYTIQIFSSDGVTAINKQISKPFITFILTLITIFFLGIVALVSFYGKVYVKAMKVQNLEERNKYLEEEFKKIITLEEDIVEISKQREKLEIALGIKRKKSIPENEITNNPVIMSDEKEVVYKPAETVFENPEMANYLEESKKQSRSIPNIVPVNGWITKRFNDIHKGIDIAAPIGTPVFSAMDGTISFAGWDSIFGNSIKIEGSFDYATFYGHCSTIYVKKGDFVRKGEIIASVGQTGKAAAPHIHYEIMVGDRNVNPQLFFLTGQTH